MRPRLHICFYFAGAFLLLAPLSVAGDVAFAEQAKYLRVLATVAIIAIASTSAKGVRLGTASYALILFLAVFTGSSLWSTLPHWALFYKGMFALSCLSGIALISVCRSERDVLTGVQFLGFLSCAAAVLCLAVYMRDPTGGSIHGRVSMMGMNANGVGHTASSMLLLTTYAACNSRRKLTRLATLPGSCVLAVLIVGSGSRASVLASIIGLIPILWPSFKRRPSMLFGWITLGIGGMIVYEFAGMAGASRLSGEMMKDTRSKIWALAFRHFEQAPLIGHGWMHLGTKWATFQNAYLQVLLECGLIGAAVLVLSILTILGKLWQSQRRLRREASSRALFHLAVALLSSNLLHGMFESSLVTSASVAPMLLGIGVGLADRMVSLAKADESIAGGYRYYWIYQTVEQNTPPAPAV